MSVSLEESTDKGRPGLAGRRIDPEGRGSEFSFSAAFGETMNLSGYADSIIGGISMHCRKGWGWPHLPFPAERFNAFSRVIAAL
ncbi:hypothetical protein [Nonomuraea dietziae]|uniref:hypothetical protein n=1 Tax=Nonomuraea dietziae TaxID=65515 RepID=UPI0033D018C0